MTGCKERKRAYMSNVKMTMYLHTLEKTRERKSLFTYVLENNVK
jgi:hypothetical protein